MVLYFVLSNLIFAYFTYSQFISNPIFDHVDNNHKSLVETQIKELNKLNIHFSELLNYVVNLIEENRCTNVDDLISKQQVLLSELAELRKSQIKRISNKT